MPVLLLAQGDAAARDLLRKAIEARYGLRPPAIESLCIQFKGRARTKIGPLSTWVPVEATALFNFPTAMRWDFIVRAVGIQIGSGAEAFDGASYRTTRAGKTPLALTEPDRIDSMQRRLWAIAALLLTPLGEHFVRVAIKAESRLEATNTKLNVPIQLALRSNYLLEQVEVTCLNPDTNQQQRFSLSLSEEQRFVNDLMLPGKISAFWDDEPYFEIEPVATEMNPAIPSEKFALADYEM